MENLGTVDLYKVALQGSESFIKSHKADERIRRRKPEMKKRPKQFPASQSQEKGRDPVLLFPEEVWEIILDEVTDSLDLESCSLTCQLFHKILKPRRTEWMFTKAFPLLYHHLDKPSILNCRLSCKNWTEAIDHHIDNILSSIKIPTYTKIHTLFTQKGLSSSFHQFLPTTGHYFPHFNVEVRQDQLTYTSRHGIPLSKITPDMELSQRNPFLGRHLVFLDIIFTKEIVNQAIQLVENCGHHIWYLEVSPLASSEEDIDVIEMTRFFKEGLPKMPNLKKIDLLMTRNFVEIHLLEIIENSCKSLESLSISRVPNSENMEEENSCSSSALAKSPLAQQLHSLELVTWKPIYFDGGSWSNLEMLTLWNVNSSEMLFGLLKFNLEALEILKLHFSYGYHDSSEDKLLESLLLISNHFSKLSCLELVNTPGIPEAPESLAALPKDLYATSHLSELTVHFKDSRNPNLLTFLLRFPFLKNLYVRNIYDNCRVFRKILEDNEVDVMGVYNALTSRCIDDVDELIYKAEIWKLLPFLEVLGVVLERSVKDKIVVFTREGYTFRKSERFISRVGENDILPFPGMGPLIEDIWD